MDDRALHPSTRTSEGRNRQAVIRDAIRRSTLDVPRWPAPTSAPIEPNPIPQLSTSRGRIFGIGPPQSHLLQHRLRLQRQGNDPSFRTVQETIDDLENSQYAGQPSAAALSRTLPNPAGLEELDSMHEGSTNYGRRSKRRKLDSDPLDAMPKISYGYHGQVQPGRLNMMITYCDGGSLQDNRQYHLDNLLQNDKTTYCSRESKFDLILSHWREIPFTCTKIVIKTPPGYPAPVREGMVFIFMKLDNIREATSRFQLRNTPSCSQGRTPPADSSRRRARLPLHDDTATWLTEPSESRRDPSSLVHEMPAAFDFDAFLAEPVHQSRSETSSSLDETTPTTQTARLPYLSVISAYDKHITTSCDPPSDEEEEITSDHFPSNRQRGMLNETDSSEDEDSPPYSNTNNHHCQRYHLRPIEWIGKDPTSVDDGKPPGKDVPYKRFYIHRDKHVVSIKFDPPVTGRHILFKLWSPQDRQTVNLQSISVYGYAGPRFFAALSTR